MALLLLFATGCKSPGTDLVLHDASAGSKAHIKRIAYASTDKGTVVKVYSNIPLEYSTYSLSEPIRIAVEIPNVALDFEPRKTEINDKTVSHVSVVAFPEIDSVRLELQLYRETPFSVSMKKGRLEILVSEDGPLFTAPMEYSGTDKNESDKINPTVGADYENKTRQELLEEINILKAKIAEERENNIKLELENSLMRKQASEAQKQFDETMSLAETLQARVVFMEKQLSNIQTRLIGDNADASAKGSAKAPIAAPDDPETAIKKMVEEWIKAWNMEDIKNYAEYYSSDFKFGYMDKKEWVTDKAFKFKRPGVPEINVEELEITIISSRTARATFHQLYRSNSFNSRGLKTLSLTKESGKWKILDENWSRIDN